MAGEGYGQDARLLGPGMTGKKSSSLVMTIFRRTGIANR
jgi:hypothetical protein